MINVLNTRLPLVLSGQRHQLLLTTQTTLLFVRSELRIPDTIDWVDEEKNIVDY